MLPDPALVNLSRIKPISPQDLPDSFAFQLKLVGGQAHSGQGMVELKGKGVINRIAGKDYILGAAPGIVDR